MDECQETKLFICEIGKRLYERGYAAANAGNISVRLGENRFLITPTGESKGFLTPEMLVEIDKDCNVIGGTHRCSSEAKMHVRVYQTRSDINAVVHAHPPYSTVFAIARTPLDKKYIPEAILSIGQVPVAAYGTPSTNEVPDSLMPYVSDHNALLLEHHGALTYGKNLKEAYFRMETLEFYAMITFFAQQLPGVKEMTQEQVKKLLALGG